MTGVEKTKKTIARILRVLFFAGVVIIDVVRCSGNGAQWACGNRCTGLVIGSIILIHYGIKPLNKLWIYIGTVVVLAAIITANKWFYFIPGMFYGDTMAILANIWMWIIIAYLLIKDWRNRLKGRKIIKEISLQGFGQSIIKRPIFLLWFLYMLLAWIVPCNVYKPGFSFLIFGMILLVPFGEKEKKEIFSDLLSGLLCGFWLQQIAAFVQRPYTEYFLRYRGMYYNSNMYSLICFIVLAASLIKIYELRKTMQKSVKKTIIHILLAIESIFVYCFIFLSIGRITCFLSTVLILAFMAIVWIKKEKMRFQKIALHLWTCFLVFIILFPVSFLCVKYLPQIQKKPYYIEDEYWHSEDLENPNSYVSSRMFLDEFFGRISKIWGSNISIDEEKEAEPIDESKLDPERATRKYYLNYEEGYNAMELRVAIWKTFGSDLNAFGHTDFSKWVSPDFQTIHAHNAFIQMMFAYGIICGGFFLLWAIAYLFETMRFCKNHKEGWIGLLPLIIWFVFFGFGFVEQDWQLGQATWFLLMFTQMLFVSWTTKQAKAEEQEIETNPVLPNTD